MNYRNTEDLWKKHSDTVRRNLNETSGIKRDNMLTAIQYCFTFGIILLVISFVYSNFNGQKDSQVVINTQLTPGTTPTITPKIEIF